MTAPSSLSPSPCPPSALSIAGRAGHAFTPHAMMQGFTCHARGVELAGSDPARAHVRVRSKRLHDVLLRADGGRLVVACTCPARLFGLDVCKHAWAALLEVDRQDGLSDFRKTRGPLVVLAAPLPAAPSSAAPAAIIEAAMTPPRARSNKAATTAPSSKEKTTKAAKKTGTEKTKATAEATAAPAGTKVRAGKAPPSPPASKKKPSAETMTAPAGTKARSRKSPPSPPARTKHR